MSQTVWKQAVKVADGPVEVVLPESARVRRVEHAPGMPSSPYDVEVWVWFTAHRVDDDRPKRTWTWQCAGTGQEAPDAWVYLGSTAPHPVNGLVWHLWEVHGGR